MSNLKTLSDILKAEDLENYGNKVCLVAGVGSGKNYWVENELTKHGKVLLVTSRKAVKDQTLTREIFTDHTSWQDDNDKTCTHQMLGTFVKNNYFPGLSKQETAFDYVVIDEAHAIITDASFSDAPFYLWEFLKHVKSKKVILMSATISCIEGLLKEKDLR